MKNINIILIILSLVFTLVNAEDSILNEIDSVDKNIDVNSSVGDINSTVVDVNISESAINNIIADVLNTTIVDVNISIGDINSTIVDVKETMSEFEKLFINHTAYIYYSTSIKELYTANYKNAYENAMKAKAIYDNTDEESSQIIALPYMPSYIRESGFTAKRIYYKVIKANTYELRRLITKIKLISPPIATVVLKKTSTYIDVIIKNYGDLPLDGFEVLLNDEPIAKYDKILPNEEKVTRLEASPSLYEISFKEKYGFAPNSIMLSEDE